MSVETFARSSAELFAPERLSAAGIGADEDVFRTALEPLVGRAVAA